MELDPRTTAVIAVHMMRDVVTHEGAFGQFFGEGVERHGIVAQVGQINGVVSEIAASAQEQATGLEQVNVAVTQMGQATQQNAAMVEQSTAASHQLAAEAAELTRLVGAFRGLGRSATQGAGVTPLPASRPAAPVRPAAPARARTVLAAVRGGGAARKLEAAVNGHWAEF